MGIKLKFPIWHTPQRRTGDFLTGTYIYIISPTNTPVGHVFYVVSDHSFLYLEIKLSSNTINNSIFFNLFCSSLPKIKILCGNLKKKKIFGEIKKKKKKKKK